MHVAILTGGKSEEREIALTSAGNVQKMLAARYDIVLFDLPKDLDAFLLQRKNFSVVIPVFHGRGGEDGTVQGFLETLGVPYLFSGVAAQAIGIDKDLAKRVVSSFGVNTAPWMVMMKDADRELWSGHFPCVVKPVDGGSTQGIALVRSSAELDKALGEAFRLSDRVLVENCIEGDEFTVAVIEEQGKPIAMPVVQIKSATGFYDYAAKYGSQPAEKLCPAPITEELSQRLQDAAIAVHKGIHARHMTRTDFMVDCEGVMWFLEVNTIPGLSVLLPRAVKASGRDFTDVLAAWIEEVVA